MSDLNDLGYDDPYDTADPDDFCPDYCDLCGHRLGGDCYETRVLVEDDHFIAIDTCSDCYDRLHKIE